MPSKTTRRTNTSVRRTKRKKTSFPFMVFMSVIVVGAGMVIAANSSAGSIFQAQKVESKIQDLREENENLQIQASTLQSLQNLKESVQTESSLVPISKLNHVMTAEPKQNKSFSQR